MLVSQEYLGINDIFWTLGLVMSYIGARVHIREEEYLGIQGIFWKLVGGTGNKLRIAAPSTKVWDLRLEGVNWLMRSLERVEGDRRRRRKGRAPKNGTK